MLDFKEICLLIAMGLILMLVPAAMAWGLGWLIAPRVGDWALPTGQWIAIGWAVLIGAITLVSFGLETVRYLRRH